MIKLLGMGIGYPIRTKDGKKEIDSENGKVRADSFSLYLKTVS